MGRGLVPLPVRNEATMFDASFHRRTEGRDASGLGYRPSIAEEGSTDGTVAMIERRPAGFPDSLVRTSPLRRGQGLALRQGWTSMGADKYAFVGADLPAGPPALVAAIAVVQRGPTSPPVLATARGRGSAGLLCAISCRTRTTGWSA